MDDHSASLPTARKTIRASDSDREQSASRLRDGYSHGRLTLDELQQRLDEAYASKTLAQLDALLADLPIQDQMPPIPTPEADPAAAAGRKRVRERVLTYVILMLFLVSLWAISGRQGSFWPIWPIVIGAFILSFDLLGLEHPTRRGRARRRLRDRGLMDDRENGGVSRR